MCHLARPDDCSFSTIVELPSGGAIEISSPDSIPSRISAARPNNVTFNCPPNARLRGSGSARKNVNCCREAEYGHLIVMTPCKREVDVIFSGDISDRSIGMSCLVSSGDNSAIVWYVCFLCFLVLRRRGYKRCLIVSLATRNSKMDQKAEPVKILAKRFFRWRMGQLLYIL